MALHSDDPVRDIVGTARVSLRSTQGRAFPLGNGDPKLVGDSAPSRIPRGILLARKNGDHIDADSTVLTVPLSGSSHMRDRHQTPGFVRLNARDLLIHSSLPTEGGQKVRTPHGRGHSWVVWRWCPHQWVQHQPTPQMMKDRPRSAPRNQRRPRQR
jgi:hypothetical protein